MKSGILPNNYDSRDYSHERTFGTVDTKLFPDEYNADLGLSFPDQDADGYPNGCTGYTQSETGQDEYGTQFDPAFTYKKTLLIANLPDNSPCKIRDSFKATRVYGLLPKGGTEDEALQFKRGQYFDVDKNGDYFDGVRSALWLNQLNKRTISVGTPWYWGRNPKNGILFDFDKKKEANVWHNWKICGWKQIQGKPYLIGKPWVGKGGDKGYVYISRETFNKLMNIRGTFMYTQANAKPEDIQTIKLDILEVLLEFFQRLLTNAKTMAQDTTPEVPETPPVSPKMTNREHLYAIAYSCLGIDMAPTQDEVGCAEAVSFVMLKAGIPGVPRGGILSTQLLNKWLKEHLTEVDSPEFGDIAIFPTGSGNGKIRGHVFIVGKHKWMSNNSNTTLWDDHWTGKKALEYYAKYGGLSTHYYRWVGEHTI